MKTISYVVFICLLFLVFANPSSANEEIKKLLTESSTFYQQGDVYRSMEKMQQAVDVLWQEAGFRITKSLYVVQPAQGFGVYKERKSSVFSKGEPLLIYMEPAGYRFRHAGSIYQFGFSVDFLLKDSTGKILGGQENFQRFDMKSHHPNKEFLLSLTYNFSGLPVGDYTVVTVVHDLVGGGKAVVEKGLTIK